jgi:hypothetical protein
MPGPGYPAARIAASKIEAHFARHAAAGEARSGTRLPNASDIEAVMDAAFWTSLRREEGYVPKISLALVAPTHAIKPVLFEKALPLKPSTLAKVAPAVERPGIHLGVWRVDGELNVWGATQAIPAYCFVLEVAAPGLLVVKHHRGDGGKFVNVAVLEGDLVKMIDENASRLPDCPSLLASLLSFDTAGTWNGSVNIMIDLAVSMRAHGRGGIMLVVPSGSRHWKDSIVHPVPYAVAPPFQMLTDLLQRAAAEHDEREWQEELEDGVQAIAGLTAVDGATILTDRCELLAFGAKITRRDGFPVVEHVAVTEPIEEGEAALVLAARLGGTRHLSAAQFVHDQRDSIALVASQDGRFTIFAWSPSEERVHAHRIETLLL